MWCRPIYDDLVAKQLLNPEACSGHSRNKHNRQRCREGESSDPNLQGHAVLRNACPCIATMNAITSDPSMIELKTPRTGNHEARFAAIDFVAGPQQ
jgi:hypothetical protein